jgi:deoxyribonuclease-2
MVAAFFFAVLALCLNAPSVAASSGNGSGGMQCIGDSNSPVDWYVVLKFPGGSGYAYTDSETVHLGLRKSPYELESATDGAVTHTLRQIYNDDDEEEVGFAKYNDDDPNDHAHGTGGHTKGVVGWEGETGFWLIHSVPRFPSFAKDGAYAGLPDNELRYGQSMLCLSLDVATLDDVASQLLIGYPWVYDTNFPSKFEDSMPNMKKLSQGEKHGDYESHSLAVRTLGGTSFRTFYKSPKWESFLYEEMVQQYYKTGMLWETWMNGINPDPSFCTPKYAYDSINVRRVSVTGHDWKETQDHSKWGIAKPKGGDSNEPGIPLVCIGDINRQASQNHRGGGTTCIINDDLHEAFTGIITTADKCSSSSSSS